MSRILNAKMTWKRKLKWWRTKTWIPTALWTAVSQSTNSPFPWPCSSQFPAQSALYPSSALFAPLEWSHGYSSPIIAHLAHSSIIMGMPNHLDQWSMFSNKIPSYGSNSDSISATQILTKFPMVQCLHLRVPLIPDVVVNGLPHWFILLEADVRVPEDLSTNAAWLGANGCPITGSAKGQGIL